MDDRPISWEQGEFTVSTDRIRLDHDAVYAELRATHWGPKVTRALLERSIVDSLAFGLYRGGEQVGFARVVTDRSTYGYLTDVYVAEPRRNQGLGEWLVRCIVAHPDLQGLRRLTLLTHDAASLYERVGFRRGSGDALYMERLPG